MVGFWVVVEVSRNDLFPWYRALCVGKTPVFYSVVLPQIVKIYLVRVDMDIKMEY